jgi:phosphatidylserine/phosphatidylglycerophosphate/cardiolipin synthase-like enzyme
MKISVAMLNTCGIENGRWRYREIYIHSKLMLVDDTFMTIGSANLNIRSMNVDSEINLATVNPALVKELRRNIWSSLSGKVTDGNQGTHADIKEAYQKLAVLLSGNHGLKENSEKLVGFLLPLRDDRSSNLRLG